MKRKKSKSKLEQMKPQLLVLTQECAVKVSIVNPGPKAAPKSFPIPFFSSSIFFNTNRIVAEDKLPKLFQHIMWDL